MAAIDPMIRPVSRDSPCFGVFAKSQRVLAAIDVLKYDPAMRPTASRLTVDWEHVPEELERQ